MGNFQTTELKKPSYPRDSYYSVSSQEFEKIKKDNEIILVDYFEKNYVLNKISQYPSIYKKSISDMLSYYTNHRDKNIYKKTDCLCNFELNMCIVNRNANFFRKIYDGETYQNETHYVSMYYPHE